MIIITHNVYLVISGPTAPDPPTLKLAASHGGAMQLEWTMPKVTMCICEFDSRQFQTMVLTYDMPQETGGTPIVRRSLFVEGVSLDESANESSFSHCQLRAEKEYTYRLEIENSKGLVKSTTQTFQTATYSPPSDLPQLTLVSARVGSATFNVSEPCDKGGYSELDYSYELRNMTSGAIVSQAWFNCCDLKLNGLQSSTEYILRVRVNTMGEGNWTETGFLTPSGLPSIPSTTLLYATTTQLELSITPPIAVNTSVLQINVVARKTLGVDPVYNETLNCSLSGSTTVCPESVVINNLDETETSYQVQVRAIADGGASDWSESAYMTDSGEPGTLGFRKSKYSVKEGESLTVGIARLYGTTISESATFDVADTIAFASHGWSCEQTSFGASCAPSDSGTNSGEKHGLPSTLKTVATSLTGDCLVSSY